MTTVLLVPGAWSGGNVSTVEAALGGPQEILNYLGISDAPTVVPIAYSDMDTTWGYLDGANKIMAELHALPADEMKVVVGHSYGAVANCQVLRQLTGIDPATVVFINAANSIRPDTGAMGGMYGGVGPVSNKWHVIDVAAEFDKWADQPNNYLSPYYWQAVNVCNAGDMVSGTDPDGVPINIHNAGYEHLRLGLPHAEATIGTVTFMLFETDPVPGSPSTTRAQLQTAFNRIVSPNW